MRTTTASVPMPSATPRKRDRATGPTQLDAQGEHDRPQKVGVALHALAEVEHQLARQGQVARVAEGDVGVVGDEIEQVRVRHQHGRAMMNA
jgi:hypothetical protein